MTMTLHIPKPRHFCNDCEKPIPGLCRECQKHPGKSVPIPIELYDFPVEQIVKVCESGHCIKFRCARKECPNKPDWRVVSRNYASKKIKSERVYCGRSCSALAATDAKPDKSVEVLCSCDCGSKRRVPPAIIKRQRYF